jgi:conjugal transfer mating pair stabilization protein TraN
VVEPGLRHAVGFAPRWPLRGAGSGAQAFDASGALTSQASSGGVQLGGGGAILGTALNVIMVAYAVYMIFNLIVQMVWQCQAEEYELAAKKELKTCSYLGSYCQSQGLGGCWEDRESYCCFASPLARILQEQIRPQLGWTFGTAKQPDCRGIPIDRLAGVDWNRVNLDEWLGLLQAPSVRLVVASGRVIF